jgi:hypothetical protein
MSAESHGGHGGVTAFSPIELFEKHSIPPVTNIIVDAVGPALALNFFIDAILSSAGLKSSGNISQSGRSAASQCHG